MFKLILKFLRPEVNFESDVKEISEADDSLLKEDLRNSFPNLSEEELNELVQNLKQGLTPIDGVK